ncbi:hypothetical protein JHK82_045039 [Glycine max]|uniref:Uncharacterized protein n=1 Tax=Glycine soja TaxID=3848 RepID=A0A0B2SHH8_GLYSO|nr:hypothetical protein JHK86_045456 [Glycine max]KHN44505.1 hypothetical protein glysoja_035737 [Glycine soja]KAG4952169.1 hypothetical protein JHK85_046036 [Glycine max]KAG5099987.1 hypothetical protein JHK82_045039 [Glycine max]KAG5108589.1 hypothetical protein JHK84_045496 [Glycine max]
MAMPFIASPSSQRVSRSNSGAWLIIRPMKTTPGSHVVALKLMTLDGEGKCSKLEGEVRMQHVTYTEDVTAFVILAVTLDLSIDACKLFSQKLQKDLRQ